VSQENVEIVRQGIEAFASGDLTGAMRASHPEMVTRRVDPDDAIFHGPEGLLDAISDWVESFTEWGISAEEYLDAGDQVLVRLHQWGRGESSAAAVEGTLWVVFTVSEGIVTRVEMHNIEEQALEAAGLLK
jgi:SnoaL-like domain